MAFSDLPAELQLLELFQFEMFTRTFWLFLIISFSLIYIFYWRPYKEDKTPFYSVATMRGMLYVFSIVTLIVTPLLFLAMSPEQGGWNIIFTFINLYLILMGIYALTLNVDLIRYGYTSILRLGGLKFGTEKDVLAHKKLFGGKNKW